MLGGPKPGSAQPIEMRRADDDAKVELRDDNDDGGAVDGVDDTDTALNAIGGAADAVDAAADNVACPGAPGESTESERPLIAAQIGDCGSDKEEKAEFESFE